MAQVQLTTPGAGRCYPATPSALGGLGNTSEKLNHTFLLLQSTAVAPLQRLGWNEVLWGTLEHQPRLSHATGVCLLLSFKPFLLLFLGFVYNLLDWFRLRISAGSSCLSCRHCVLCLSSSEWIHCCASECPLNAGAQPGEFPCRAGSTVLLPVPTLLPLLSAAGSSLSLCSWVPAGCSLCSELGAPGNPMGVEVCRSCRILPVPHLTQAAVRITVGKGRSPTNCRPCAIPPASLAAPGPDRRSSGSWAQAACGASLLRTGKGLWPVGWSCTAAGQAQFSGRYPTSL